MPGVNQKNYRLVADSAAAPAAAASTTTPAPTSNTAPMPSATTLQSLCALSEEGLSVLLQSGQNARRLHWFLHERYSPAATSPQEPEASAQVPSADPNAAPSFRKPQMHLAKLAQKAALTFPPFKK